MSPLGYIAAMGGLISVGLVVAVWAMKLRLSGVKWELKASGARRVAVEDLLVSSTRNFTDYRARAEEKEAHLTRELHHFRKEELDGIEKEPDRDVRIRRRRSWVSSMLRISSPSASDDGGPGMREDTAT